MLIECCSGQFMSPPTIIRTRRKPRPTQVFRTYWRFAAKRQRIFRTRLASVNPDTHIDPILRRFRFTNAYRASDRTSQFLIRHVIYGPRERSFRDRFARVVLFKLFNRIETWQLLERTLGPIDVDMIDPERLACVLHRARESGQSIYSAAYIMPSPAVFGSDVKHENHLRLLRRMLDDDAHQRIQDSRSMRDAYQVLISYPSIGPFLAYQLITDLNYCPDLDFSESEFVVPGPGALDGLKKCFFDPGEFSDAELIRWTMERQADEFEACGVGFEDLWGRPLQLIDCQNLYCEVDKYAREAHPNVRGVSGRRRIKRRFTPRSEPITAWYPPKWGINDVAKEWIDRQKKQALPGSV